GSVRSVLALLILAPVLAPVPAAILDLGPESEVRLSIFPLALAVFDPLVWTSLWNGLAVAGIVAVGSLLIGVQLGRIVAHRRLWGRPILAALVVAPAVVPPAFLALGLLGPFGPP